MTYQELENLRYLKKEIKHLERKLKEASDDMGALRSPALSGLPSSPSLLGQPARETEKLDEIRSVYEKQMKIYAAELLKTERYIAEISGSYTRLIFSLRFIDGFSWVKVAMTIGGNNTPDGVRMIVRRYLEKHP